MARHCSYCGFENTWEAEQCLQCGTDLPQTAEPPGLEPAEPPIIVAEPKAALNARFATLAFFVYMAGQVIGSIVFGTIAFAIGLVNPTSLRDAAQADEAKEQLFMFVALPTVLAGGGAALLLSLQRIRPHLRDASPTGAAWLVGSFRQILTGFGIGALVAIGYAILGSLFPPENSMEMGPIARMGMTPGVQQIIWLSVALLFAPVIEECLFRGVIYGGYRRSLGPVWAAILSILLFWALHLTETFGYWPAMIGIFALATVALWYRLKCSAIGPAVAVHTGYNAVISVGALFASSAAQ
jgi:membrane protease YdiL (CAAX protease family)